MKKELYMMFKAGSFWTFGMARIIIDLLWLFLGCHGSFWPLYEQRIIYKSRQWVICFLNLVGNYNIGDVIICNFHRPFVIWCMTFVDICTSTNSMIVHHGVNFNIMYIYSVLLSLTILVYVIYLYSSKEHLQRCAWTMKIDFFVGYKK